LGGYKRSEGIDQEVHGQGFRWLARINFMALF
jgi:hypothetical protein